MNRLRGSGGTGRRARLRGVWFYHTGSTPVSRTNKKRPTSRWSLFVSTETGPVTEPVCEYLKLLKMHIDLHSPPYYQISRSGSRHCQSREQRITLQIPLQSPLRIIRDGKRPSFVDDGASGLRSTRRRRIVPQSLINQFVYAFPNRAICNQEKLFSTIS